MRVCKMFLILFVWLRIAFGLACFLLMNVIAGAAIVFLSAVFAFAPRLRGRAISIVVRAGMRAIFTGLVPLLGGYDLFIDSAKADFSRPSIYVCNHISIFDPLILFALIPNLGVVIKRKYASILAIWLLARVFDFVAIDGDGGADEIENVLKSAGGSLSRGRNMLIFPEGTRGRVGTVGEFKKSAFKLAIETGAPVAPVAIYSPRPFLGKGAFSIREKTYYKIKFLEPMLPEEYRGAPAMRDAACAAVLAEVRRMRDKAEERPPRYF